MDIDWRYFSADKHRVIDLQSWKTWTIAERGACNNMQAVFHEHVTLLI